MSNTRSTRRSQADRRAASRQALLESACRHFGARGYAETSLEDIAADCGLTIRPIYHYFGSKQSLFATVYARMEQRVADAIAASASQDAGIRENWRAFAALCEDPSFRRILLVDGPAVLGRAHWGRAAEPAVHCEDRITAGAAPAETASSTTAAAHGAPTKDAAAEHVPGGAPGGATATAAASASVTRTESPEQAAQIYGAALLNRVVMAAFAEAALMLAEAGGAKLPRRVTEDMMVSLFSRLRGSLSVPEQDPGPAD